MKGCIFQDLVLWLESVLVYLEVDGWLGQTPFLQKSVLFLWVFPIADPILQRYLIIILFCAFNISWKPWMILMDFSNYFYVSNYLI